ncbi:unnamed protein product [Schistocephalus solidus]|uniref:Secreted protein n=1 Tax=Schistocephalus solidus TaxID=70667 RepID=A0A183S7M1_SCHSO|nr:unnamed protein product [Schistocephalus solidus]
MLLWPPLTGTQLSPVALRSWVLPCSHTPGNRHDRGTLRSWVLPCSHTPDNRHDWRAKSGEGLRFCEQLVGTKDGISRSGTGMLQDRHCCSQGYLEEVGAGYTFVWSGQSKAERRDAGVAFAIRNDIVGVCPVCHRVSMIT